LFAGRKLLVADDSPYYQTVLGLTFTDEGMEVATAGDSQAALEKLEQSTPDVILASVSIPGMGGYELCRWIKQSERFGHIPVMLLAGLHENFDQAEARRVGADDVVTKPFQSIRQLVGRVGTLLGGKGGNANDASHEYSMLGLDRQEGVQTTAPDKETMAEPEVKVFVEAASMTEHETSEPAFEATGSACAADVALQTADTQQLEPIQAGNSVALAGDNAVYSQPQANDIQEPVSAPPIQYAQDDTVEMEPAMTPAAKLSPPDGGTEQHQPSANVPEMEAASEGQTAPPQTRSAGNDGLLDLGHMGGPTQSAVSADLILDLEFEEPASASVAAVPVYESAEVAGALPAEIIAPEPTYYELPAIEVQEWEIAAAAPAEAAPPAAVTEPETASEPDEPDLGLSPEVIDAIARRAVELLSEKVVREIAWEVVPELAELLIKKKLEEQG
jgi:CheY-like chemotaxis protein